MRGKKVDIDAYLSKGKKKKRYLGFSFEETLLSHYETLKGSSKKTASEYYKNEIHETGYLKNGALNESIVQYLIKVKSKAPFAGPSDDEIKFSFIDLFAGIGGFRIALQNLGGKCVFSSEWDKYAQLTYQRNFGEIPYGDITKKEIKNLIPQKFDLLTGGFPCQPFSLAGVSKKNALGRKHGFEDEKQGNLFFHIAEILEEHRPKAFLLENVKNLVSHDKGMTFKIIRNTLENLGYSFNHRVLDGKHFVPQHRERTIMVGFDKLKFGNDISFDFDKIELPEANKKVKNILLKRVDDKYTLSTHLWEYLQAYALKHQQKGNGFGFGLVNLESISRTMSARYYKDGAEILIPQEGKNPRRLSPEECARLQGFPKQFVIPVSDNQAYKQFGNSVVVPLIQSVGEKIIQTLILK